MMPTDKKKKIIIITLKLMEFERNETPGRIMCFVRAFYGVRMERACAPRKKFCRREERPV